MMNHEDEEVLELKNEIKKVVSQCWNCNFCYPACPLRESNVGFQTQGPSGIAQSLFYAIKWDCLEGPEKEGLRDIVYACTTCNSCVNTCKQISAGVPLLEAVDAGRQLLIEKMIGPMPQQAKALESAFKYGNPYGQQPDERLNWANGLDIKRLPAEKADLLYFVGCTAAHDPDLHNCARSIVKLLKYANTDIGILGEEVCCGDPVRSIGDPYLFEELAGKNIQNIEKSGVKKIVTTSPHCFNTLTKSYKDLPEGIVVQHYTEFFHDFFKDHLSDFKKNIPLKITYHDPCYLGKHNQIYEDPRQLIQFIPGVSLIEMEKNRSDSLCCGGGGGRMFTEVEEEERMANVRIRQALDTGAEILATACPYCYIMFRDAIKDVGAGEKIKVMDIAELLCEALNL